MPTAEEIQQHAERYPLPDGRGLWRVIKEGEVPRFESLRVSDVVGMLWPPIWHRATWTPCDQAGNPIVLLEANEDMKRQVTHSLQVVEHLRKQRDEATARMLQCKEERDWYMAQQEPDQ